MNHDHLQSIVLDKGKREANSDLLHRNKWINKGSNDWKHSKVYPKFQETFSVLNRRKKKSMIHTCIYKTMPHRCNPNVLVVTLRVKYYNSFKRSFKENHLILKTVKIISNFLGMVFTLIFSKMSYFLVLYWASSREGYVWRIFLIQSMRDGKNFILLWRAKREEIVSFGEEAESFISLCYLLKP